MAHRIPKFPVLDLYYCKILGNVFTNFGKFVHNLEKIWLNFEFGRGLYLAPNIA